MTSLLDTNEQTVGIVLYYTERQSVTGYVKFIVLDEKKAKDMLADPQKKDRVHCLNTVWKVMSWKDDNEIVKQSTYFNVNSSMNDLDPFKYRDLRIKQCIRSWDMKDDKGNAIQFRPELIDKMPSDIVHALIAKYDSAMTIDEEEEKK